MNLECRGKDAHKTLKRSSKTSMSSSGPSSPTGAYSAGCGEEAHGYTLSTRITTRNPLLLGKVYGLATSQWASLPK